MRTSSRPGRPALEPNTRCTIAATIAAARTPAIAPSGVLAPSATTPSAASVTSHRPSRRRGRPRCGEAVTMTAPATAMRGDGYQGRGSAERSAPHASGHEPLTDRPTTSHTTIASRPARTRSRATAARRATSAPMMSTTASSASRSTNTCQRPSSTSGVLCNTDSTVRRKPGCGTAAATDEGETDRRGDGQDHVGGAACPRRIRRRREKSRTAPPQGSLQARPAAGGWRRDRHSGAHHRACVRGRDVSRA